MRDVISERLWIGNAKDARDVQLVLSHGISGVIDVAMDEPPIQFPRDIIYCRFPLVDGGENPSVVMQAAIQTSITLLSGGLPILIACSGGMSRSPAIVAAVLSVIRSCHPDDALKEVTNNAPHDVSPNLWSDVKDALNRLHLNQDVRLEERLAGD